MAGAGPQSVSKRGRDVRRIFRLRFRDIGGLIRESASEWSDDNAMRLSASLAFYTLLSLAPLLVVIVAIAAVAFGRKAAEGQLAWEIQGMLGMEQARAVEALILGALKPNQGAIATVISVITLALGATAVVVELQDALQRHLACQDAERIQARRDPRLGETTRLLPGDGFGRWISVAGFDYIQRLDYGNGGIVWSDVSGS
jgi:hypothetical protein